MDKVVKKTDSYTAKSANLLKAKVYSSIKGVFVGALKCIEIRFGTDFEGYENMRKEILRCGNDAIREINEAVDNDFNVEAIPTWNTVVFKGQDQKGE